jgi:phosphatidate cytidylyltransferase
MSARRGKKGSFGPGIDSKDEDEVREVVYASDNAYTDLETEEDEEEEKPRKTVTRKSIMTRAITAWILIGTYMLVLRAGHFYCIMTGVLTQVELFRELVNVRYVPAKDRKVPLFRTLQWGWFFAAMMWAYGEAIHRFCTEHGSFQSIIEFTQYTPQATFVVYCILFVISTLTLRQSQVRFQISQYMWTIVIICLVVRELWVMLYVYRTIPLLCCCHIAY